MNPRAPFRPHARVAASLAATFAASLALSGCGEQVAGTRKETLYPTKGQVLLASGKPLNGGTVILIPTSGQDSSPIGEIDSSGNFTLKTKGEDGAAAGTYKVRIEPPASAVTAKKGGVGAAKSLPFPASYSDADGETGLTATVKAEPTTLEPFRLTSDKGKGAAATRD